MSSKFVLVKIGSPIKFCQLCGRDDRKTGCIIWRENQGDYTICCSHLQTSAGISLCDEFDIRFLKYECPTCENVYEIALRCVGDIILPEKCGYCCNILRATSSPYVKTDINWLQNEIYKS